MAQQKSYEIDRVLNNNVIVILSDNHDDEQIVVGKGIGFGSKRGMPFSLEDVRIEKRFTLVHAENQSHFRQLFSIVSPEVIGTTEEIIAFATKQLKTQLHEHIHVALADHIGFALTRLRGGLNIENPFLEEIKTLYPAAWNVAKSGASLIETRFEIPIPEEEIGFLTLHLHSATHTRGLSETVRITDAVNIAIREIEQILGRDISTLQLNYARLVIHLRFAMQRILRNEPIQNPLAQTISEKIPESYAIAGRVSEVMAKRLKKEFPVDEIAYLALHIDRISNQETSD